MVLVGLACFAGGAGLAYFHPLAPIPLLVGFCLWVVAVFLWQHLWIFVLPAMLPVVGLASWTGWFTFEEFDILVLGAAAGAYLRLGLSSHRGSETTRRPERFSVISLVLILLFSVSLVLALYRGFADAGGFSFGWFQGYDEPMNSLRLFKSFFLALLLMPLMQNELRKSDSKAIGLLSKGMVFGLGAAALACLWERAAFPGALNFSGDYRTTALFWEMHTGGAALDGFLALTAPFAVRETLRAKGPVQLVIALSLVALAVYACLTTFSRGVYLGAVVSLGLLVLLLYRCDKVRSGTNVSGSLVKAAVIVVSACIASYLGFRSGGYRALISILGVFAITLLFGNVARSLSPREGGLALSIGAVLGALSLGFALVFAKGAYIAFTVAFLICLTIRWWQRSRGSEPSGVSAIAGYLWLIVSAMLVAYAWGGEPALVDMSIALSLLCAVFIGNVRARQPLWPNDLRWQGMAFGSVLMLAGSVAIFSGGAYMSERFSTSEGDLEVRIQHWSRSLDLLQSQTDWLFGKGLGRFPATYFYSSRMGEFPGSYHLQSEGGDNYLKLSGPRYANDGGEYLRVSQRVPVEPDGKYLLEFDVRSDKDIVLKLEICEKHLLYRAGCVDPVVRLKASGQAWQHVTEPLDGKDLTGGPWYAPRLGFFSIALESAGVADVDNFSLVRGDGRNLLANGNFSSDMAHWFFTSDHYHLPWHIKNIFLNVLFDQGWVGLLIFILLGGGALWRLILGGARGHVAAPYLASSLVWALVVGGFDSLLDVPRLAFLFYLLVLLSLMLNGSAAPVARASGPSRKSSSRSRTAHQ